MISRQKRASIPRAGTPVPEPVTHAARGGSKRAVQAPVPPTRPWEPLNISASMSKSRHALRPIHETCRSGATNDGDKSMKFMLMMNAQRQLFDEYWRWPKADLKAHIEFMHEFGRKLSAAGELVSAEGLAAPAQAKIVRAGSDGRPVTDGPFTETKEFLAGYWIVQVPSIERACEIAAEASAAPGIGGAPINMPIEVREVLDGAPPID
jgi:hypothetical protein